MKKTAITIIYLSLLFLFTQQINAQVIEYWGKFRDRDAGLIRMENIDYEISPGVELPGSGTVRQITDFFLVVDIQLTEVDKEHLRLEGAAVYDKIQIYIPNRLFGVVPVPQP
jgi:hypothetical protein